MKAFLLAAGLGTRLYPITARIPKCLVPIKGQPLLGIWIEYLRKYGITEVLVNAHAHPGQVRGFIDRSGYGDMVSISEEADLLGSAGTIQANRDWVKSEPFFWIFYADVLTNTRLDQMLLFHNRHAGAVTLGVYEVAQPERCGIAVVDGEDCVVDFVEKPHTPRSHLAFSGLMIGTPALFDALPDSVPADIGFDVLPHMVRRMFAYPIRDFLIDVGTPENYARAQNCWPGF